MFVIDVAFLAALIGTVLPIAVGIITKKVASSGLKATLLALASAVTGVAVVAVNNGGLISKESVLAALLSWVTAVATYYGFLSKTGITEKVQDKTADFGIGS